MGAGSRRRRQAKEGGWICRLAFADFLNLEGGQWAPAPGVGCRCRSDRAAASGSWTRRARRPHAAGRHRCGRWAVVARML